MKAFWIKFKEYNRLTKMDEMGRRYFAMNSFDGILTILGVIIGNYLAGVQESSIIIATGVATSIGMGVSGIWGTFLTEDAERKKKIKDLGKITLRDLRKSKLGKAERYATVVVSLINGISPFISALLVVLPFFFFPITVAYRVATVVCFVLLVLIGVFLGKISHESMTGYAVKMVIAGIVCAGLIMFLGV